MTTQELEQKVRQIIIEKGVLEIAEEKLQPDTSFIEGDFQLDSIQTLEIMIGLEEEFEFTFDEDEINMELFRSLSNLVGYVEKSIGQDRVTA